MAIPHSSVLRAAIRWMELLPESPPDRCFALFTNAPAYTDLTPSQYLDARAWLRRRGLWDQARQQRRHAPELTVFEAAVGEAIWLPDADQIAVDPYSLPLDAIDAAGACGLTDDAAFAAVRQVHMAEDLAYRKEVGDAGEQAFVSLIRRTTRCRVEHLALTSDGYGFDVATYGTYQAHFEVKSTVRQNRTTIYLSRHEADTMLRDPLWKLIFLRLNSKFQITDIATVKRSWLNLAAPRDVTSGSEWQSARIELPQEALCPGLPILLPDVVDRSNPDVRLFDGAINPKPPDHISSRA